MVIAPVDEIVIQSDAPERMARRDRLMEMFRELRQLREDEGIPNDTSRRDLLGVVLFCLENLISQDFPWAEGDNPFRRPCT